jgi:succinyl-diaminopimelate desuccinylase
MRFIAHTLEKYYGEVFGIENTDPDFGRLTCTNGIAKMNEGKISLSFDMRYGKSVDIKSVKEKVIKYFAENGWSVEFTGGLSPWLTAADNPYLKACLNAYEKFTGTENPPTYVNAGATYGAHLPCAVELGTQIWQTLTFNMPEGHGGAHQPDENISIDGMLEALEITVHMLLECDRMGEA